MYGFGNSKACSVQVDPSPGTNPGGLLGRLLTAVPVTPRLIGEPAP